jgi:hypothetical protein
VNEFRDGESDPGSGASIAYNRPTAETVHGRSMGGFARGVKAIGLRVQAILRHTDAAHGPPHPSDRLDYVPGFR